MKNQYNVPTPKKVKFIDSPGTKIAFVSAAVNHTLCVDSEGQIWFFGENAAVGVLDRKNKL